MSTCAITMVYKDYWALSQWYTHYGRLLGYEHLYIVAHGQDPMIANLCPRANVTTIPRDNLEEFDRKRGRYLNSFADDLGQTYDWMIRTDADELICFDPSLYASFDDVFDRSQSDAVFALGLNVAETINDRVLAGSQMALGHRSTAVFSGHYSKAWATKRGTALWRHGIKVAPSKLASAPFDLPQGVYLAHLKYANVKALELANQHRIGVGNTAGKGLPGAAWKEADKTADRFYLHLVRFEDKDWASARDEAYSAITSEPFRDAKGNVLRSLSIVFKNRVTLPSWFKTRFGADQETARKPG
ncbi:Glycosyl transferase family 2 [Sulfitobacter marinus]|uniref:Glycosyl transferase family 2 n=1 Tax=Sulfitobacter marinus TaxID=394264 RepID=A0A1I6T1R1_9RHOB|nr:glycosyltransferase family 2 protein [Sulfitobacter marinus]SFS83162.1 Glycosyl transferase family 2 [Sulfitobacter marinus]